MTEYCFVPFVTRLRAALRRGGVGVRFASGRALPAVLASSASILGFCIAVPAHAQAEPGADSLPEEIIVTGTRASLDKALEAKRDAIGVVDGIFGDDIGKFPDLNVSESLQRVPGVTISRSVTGEGSQISVRGLPSEFVAVTLNGMPAASGNAGRDFDFDVFASELFTGAKISKTPSADLTEGGLAGTVDLRVPAALELPRPTALLSVGGQYASLGNGHAKPRVSGLLNWQNPDRTFGVIASVAWSESVIRNDTRQGFRYEKLDRMSGLDELVKSRVASGGIIPTVEVNGVAINDPDALLALAAETAYPILPRVGITQRTRERLGITGGFEFKPDDRFALGVNLLYAKYSDLGERHTIDGAPGFSGTNGVNAIPTKLTIVEGKAVPYAVAGTFNNVVQRVESYEETFDSEMWHGTLNTSYAFADTLRASASLGYSTSREDELRRTYLYSHTGPWSYDLTDPQWPKFSGTDFDYLDPADYTTADRPRFRPFTRKDEIYRGRFDFDWRPTHDDMLILRAGGEYTDRKKQNIQFSETRPATTVPFASVYAPFSIKKFNRGAPAGVITDFLVIDLDKGRTELLPDSFYEIAGKDLRGSWVVQEKVASGYLQSLWKFDLVGMPVAVDFGVRVSHTDQTSTGHQQVGSNFEPVSVRNRYTDVLPSLNVRLSLTNDLILRLAANRAITRPTLSELSAGTTVGSTNNLTASKGNPDLKPFRANQFDAALEWYFAPESLVSATVFYKDMESFIVSSQIQQVITGENLINDAGQNVSGQQFTVTLPVNGTGGKLYGLELSYQQPFTFLPAPLDGFGIMANLTLSESEGTLVQGGQTTRQALQGQSDISWNLIGYYEKGPFSLRAAYSYRGSYIDQFRSDLWPSGVPHNLYVKARGQLDLSARYQVTEAMGIFLDVINLNSTDYYSYDTEPGMSRDYYEQGPVLNAGVRIRF